MLKVSGILLLCGLLALSCAEDSLDKVNDGVSLGSNSNHNRELSLQAFSLHGLQGGWALSGSSGVRLEVRALRAHRFSLQSTPGYHKANLRTSVSFTLHFQSPISLPFVLETKANLQFRITVQKDSEGNDRLIVENCKLLPESIEMQPINLVKLTSVLIQNRGSFLRSTIAYNVGEMMCPRLESFFSHLSWKEASEIITVTDEIPQQDNNQGRH